MLRLVKLQIFSEVFLESIESKDPGLIESGNETSGLLKFTNCMLLKIMNQMKKKHKLFLFILLMCLASCHSQLQVQKTQNQNIKMISDSFPIWDQKAIEMIKPYKIKLDSSMNVVINEAPVELKKELPEGSLGNMVCDMLMDYALAHGQKPDFCVMNQGGLRIPTIYKGPVYVRTIYELLPFENQLVLLKVSGKNCRLLFNLIVQIGGTPESGFQMTIKGDTLSGLQINHIDFDEAKDYLVLTSDYLANGGDNVVPLKNPLQMIDLNIKIRDALFIQIKRMNSAGKQLFYKKDGRIIKN